MVAGRPINQVVQHLTLVHSTRAEVDRTPVRKLSANLLAGGTETTRAGNAGPEKRRTNYGGT